MIDLNLPNQLTLGRILAVPVLVILLNYPERWVCAAAMLLFIAASVTDVIDGFIARRRNLVSSFGKFLDPVADKLLICSVLVMLVQLGWAPGWVAVVIIAREITVTCLRAVAVESGVIIAADMYGKLKTFVQTVALCPLILHYVWFGFDPAPVGGVVLYLALALTVFSGANYLYNFYRNWLYEEKKDAGRV